jgi:hypothetical protein
MMLLMQQSTPRRMTMSDPSPTAVFEGECKKRVCIRCKQSGTLIPKEPRNYQKMRCTNCGCLLTIVKED